MTAPYRELAIAPTVAEWTESTVGWTPTQAKARIGLCEAEVIHRMPRGLAPYFTWRVARDTALAVTGTAKSMADAKDACVRAARLLDLDGWPTAFSSDGVMR